MELTEMTTTTHDDRGVLLAEHYPATWEEFIGQPLVTRQLKIAARSAKARQAPMGHTLLSSPMPGIGKTSLALLTSIELGTQIRIESGPIKPAMVPYMLMDMKDGDVLFLDEVHRLVQGGKANAEWLLHLMADGVTFGPLGMEKAPAITVIAATTDAGRLPQPILDRFEITPTLLPYTDEEASLIAIQLARKVLAPAGLPLPTPDSAAEIAKAGSNSPRHMRRVLCALRDLVWADEVDANGGAYELEDALKFAGVTDDGLPAQAQKYLLVMLQDFRGNPAGQKVIAERIGEVGGGMTELERILLDKNLIAFTKQGRILTVDGMRRARTLLAEA
jgi:Holliday junction DNA helicase RuvB